MVHTYLHKRTPFHPSDPFRSRQNGERQEYCSAACLLFAFRPCQSISSFWRSTATGSVCLPPFYYCNSIARSFLIIARPQIQTLAKTRTRRDPSPLFHASHSCSSAPCQAPTQSILGLARLHRPPGTGTGSRQEHRVAASNATQK